MNEVNMQNLNLIVWWWRWWQWRWLWLCSKCWVNFFK